MNDAVLSQRLRALRTPAPAGAFEARLEQALLAEAARNGGKNTEPAKLRTGRRWGGRLSGGIVIAWAASAAAAGSYVALGSSAAEQAVRDGARSWKAGKAELGRDRLARRQRRVRAQGD